MLGNLNQILVLSQCPLLPPKADIDRRHRYVRFVPIADIWPDLFSLGLLNHLIRALLHLQ